MNKEHPSYNIYRKLKQNPSAWFGFLVILLASFVAVFSYFLMPDNSSFGNDGILELRKKPIGFTVQLLKIKKNNETENNVFNTFINGKNTAYKYRPYEAISFNDSGVEIIIYGSNGTRKETYTYNKITQEKEGSTIKKSDLAGFENEYLTSRTYLFGTDNAGRDLLSRLIFGTRISLSIGFVSVLISLFVGISLGALAGFFRGKVDDFIMWFTTVIWSIPGIMLVIAISMALQSKGIWVTFVAVGLTTWVETARVVRGQFIELREQQFIEAARALGLGNLRIIKKHILPNVVGPIIVVATSNFASAILIEAGLSFLGLGVQPPTPSWGLMVHDGYKLMTNTDSWHLLLFPSLAICLLVLAFNLFGNALRDAFDPKSK